MALDCSLGRSLQQGTVRPPLPLLPHSWCNRASEQKYYSITLSQARHGRKHMMHQPSTQQYIVRGVERDDCKYSVDTNRVLAGRGEAISKAETSRSFHYLSERLNIAFRGCWLRKHPTYGVHTYLVIIIVHPVALLSLCSAHSRRSAWHIPSSMMRIVNGPSL